MKRNLISTAAAVTCLVSMSACSLGGNTTAEGAKESASAAGSAAASASGAQADASASAASASGAATVAASIKNDPTARKDVTMSKCDGDKAGWAAGGKVANSEKKDAEYTIVVSFTDKKSTVLARETTNVKVPAGGSADWKVDASFKAPEGVVCVLRGVDRA